MGELIQFPLGRRQDAIAVEPAGQERGHRAVTESDAVPSAGRTAAESQGKIADTSGVQSRDLELVRASYDAFLDAREERPEEEPIELDAELDELPYRIVDAYGSELEAETAEAAMWAAYQLQQDDFEELRAQGSGQQGVSIYFEGRLALRIERRIRHDELPKEK